MYAIIETGGKQYRVEKGDILDVELLGASTGNVVFDKVMFLSQNSTSKVGTPYVAGSKVQGEILCETKGPKVIAFKYKQRKNQRRKVGHRQKYSRVKIVDIIG